MRIIRTVAELRDAIKKEKQKGATVGFVPTMGYLHEGHVSLMVNARKENDLVVVSVFVNPTQFGENEDLDSYPTDFNRDKELMEEAGVDIAFFPGIKEMYPKGYNTYVEVEGQITKMLCGASREGHFRGVTTIVSKLFNMVLPDRAYFGQKDAQQVAVIKRMVKDLNIGVEIVPCPIVREVDGLALSSRNTYLTETERKDALVLSQSLVKAKKMIENGERSAKIVKEFIIDRIKCVDYALIDYVEILSAETLESLEDLSGEVLIALAVKIGKPRLIDNVFLEV